MEYKLMRRSLQPQYENNNEPPSARSVLSFSHGRQTTLTLVGSAQESCLKTICLPTPSRPIHGVHGRTGWAAWRCSIWCMRCFRPKQVGHRIEVISGDGFGNRILGARITATNGTQCILLCLTGDGQPLNRAHRLVRLIVPSRNGQRAAPDQVGTFNPHRLKYRFH